MHRKKCACILLALIFTSLFIVRCTSRNATDEKDKLLQQAQDTVGLHPGELLVKAGNNRVKLTPGGIAQVHLNGDTIIEVSHLADDYFTFKRAKLSMVLDELEKWYKVKFIYTGKIEDVEIDMDKFSKELPVHVILDRFLVEKLLYYDRQGDSFFLRGKY